MENNLNDAANSLIQLIRDKLIEEHRQSNVSLEVTDETVLRHIESLYEFQKDHLKATQRPAFDPKKASQRIKEQRQKLGINQTTLAKSMGVSTQTISNWEKSALKNFESSLDWSKLADNLHCAIDYLKGFCDTPNRNENGLISPLSNASSPSPATPCYYHPSQGDIEDIVPQASQPYILDIGVFMDLYHKDKSLYESMWRLCHLRLQEIRQKRHIGLFDTATLKELQLKANAMDRLSKEVEQLEKKVEKLEKEKKQFSDQLNEIACGSQLPLATTKCNETQEQHTS